MQRQIRIIAYQAAQCDPRKCTALKLSRHGIIRVVSQIKFLPKRTVVLNPFSDTAYSPADTERVKNFGLVALDCSWEHAEKILTKHVRGTSRCLPFLIAGNPVNFGKPTKLSTAEALAAALYIAGFREEAHKMLSIFKWGHTFFDLNLRMLESYSAAKTSTDIVAAQKVFIEELVAEECL